MSKADDIRMKIAELQDEVSCLEQDEANGDDRAAEIDDLMCKIADLRDELKEHE